MEMKIEAPKGRNKRHKEVPHRMGMAHRGLGTAPAGLSREFEKAENFSQNFLPISPAG
mgnify:CR=1 FL=1